MSGPSGGEASGGGASDAKAIPPAIRSLLACPRCRGPLIDAERGLSLVCGACALAYPVRDGIPIMLIDEARPAKP